MDGKEAASLIRDSSLADLLQEAANRNTTTRWGKGRGGEREEGEGRRSDYRMAVMDAVADPEAVARIAKQCKLNERQ